MTIELRLKTRIAFVKVCELSNCGAYDAGVRCRAQAYASMNILECVEGTRYKTI